MVKKTKKHSLLKQAATPKRIKRPPSSADNASQRQAQQDEPSRQEFLKRTKQSKLGQIILFTLLALLAIFMLMPKPQLITYQKLGLVARSIYVPTLLGGPTLVDSELYLQSIDANKAMYLCRDHASRCLSSL